MEEVISSLFGSLFILLCCLAGFLFGIWNLFNVKNYMNLYNLGIIYKNRSYEFRSRKFD